MPVRAGQHDRSGGCWNAIGGVYTLGGGFWGGGEAMAPKSHIYLPLVVRAVS